MNRDLIVTVLMVAVPLMVAGYIFLVLNRLKALDRPYLSRTPYVAPPKRKAKPIHWVAVSGDGPYRPVCITCPWAGAAVVDREVAEGAARDHGDLLVR